MKTTEAEVKEMRAAGCSVREIADRFGVTQAAIRYRLMSGEAKRERADKSSELAKVKRREENARLGLDRGASNPVNEEILKLRETTDMSYRAIAEQLGVTEKRVKYWCNDRERWRRAQERKRARDRKQGESDIKRLERAAEREAGYTRRRLRERLAKMRVSASQRGLECELTEDDLADLMSSKTCAKTGVVFDYSRDFGVSLDRIDNSRGYLRGNVQAVCWAYNRAKGASTDAVVLRLAVALVQKTIVDSGLSFEELKTFVEPTDWD